MNYDREKNQQQLARLLQSIEDLTPAQQAALGPLVDETRKRQADIEAAHEQAHEALDDWRLTMKYFLFSSEARHREIN